MNNIIAKYQPRNVVTSKTAAKNIVSQCIQFCVHSFTKKVFEFLHGVAGEKNEVPKRLRTLDKYDILGLVFRPRLEAWCNEEVVDPTTLLLTTSFKTIDPHYQYTKKRSMFPLRRRRTREARTGSSWRNKQSTLPELNLITSWTKVRQKMI